MPGRTRRLPLPVPFVGQQAGATTIVQAVRQAERDRRIAAVVLLVDSPGGSALASDLIWREVWRLRQSKPVVVLMGGRAASGGYLICASAHHIVARPATLTGSIGIWGGKFVLTELLHKLRMGHAVVQCGAAAGLYSELTPFSDQERSRIRRDQGAFYERFKAIVADGRGMTEEQVEEVARGRVWTGAQALEIGLVDELGDFGTALARAKELGGSSLVRNPQSYWFVSTALRRCQDSCQDVTRSQRHSWAVPLLRDPGQCWMSYVSWRVSMYGHWRRFCLIL